MAARHTLDEETKFSEIDVEPTAEYYGLCGVCNGHPFQKGDLEPCWNCGGDGLSILIGEDVDFVDTTTYTDTVEKKVRR